jgi:hypothetical protein
MASQCSLYVKTIRYAFQDDFSPNLRSGLKKQIARRLERPAIETDRRNHLQNDHHEQNH